MAKGGVRNVTEQLPCKQPVGVIVPMIVAVLGVLVGCGLFLEQLGIDLLM